MTISKVPFPLTINFLILGRFHTICILFINICLFLQFNVWISYMNSGFLSTKASISEAQGSWQGGNGGEAITFFTSPAPLWCRRRAGRGRLLWDSALIFSCLQPLCYELQKWGWRKGTRLSHLTVCCYNPLWDPASFPRNSEWQQMSLVWQVSQHWPLKTHIYFSRVFKGHPPVQFFALEDGIVILSHSSTPSQFTFPISPGAVIP